VEPKLKSPVLADFLLLAAADDVGDEKRFFIWEKKLGI
jgi:hypothetical protein